MKKTTRTVLTAIACWFMLSAAPTAHAGSTGVAELGDFDPEMTGPEYQQLLEQFRESDRLKRRPHDAIDEVLGYGKRNLDWLAAINSHRPDGKKLELSTAETQVGVPIDQPRENNVKIVSRRLADLRAKMPQSVQDVLFGTGTLPSEAPVADDIFLPLIREMDSVYQAASRWRLQESYLDQYSRMATMDVRGHYHLSREANLDEELGTWSSLATTKRDQLAEWLVGVCRNADGDDSSCRSELEEAARRDGVKDFYSRYSPAGQKMWDSFFKLQNPRRDVSWMSGANEMLMVPFRKPSDPAVQAFLRDNIQDEWKLGQWSLGLVFNSSAATHVTFVAGATPHVNGLGGNEITMDANRSIQEYTTRWTIRHEYGHTLGFPDCYVEFYDEARGVMINYQLDLTNLMCSRRGHILPMHVEELRAVYKH